MLSYTYEALQTFCKVFSRHSTWLTFCLVVLGCLESPHPGLFGLTPFLSLLGLEPDRVVLVLGRLRLESESTRDASRACRPPRRSHHDL